MFPQNRRRTSRLNPNFVLDPAVTALLDRARSFPWLSRSGPSDTSTLPSVVGRTRVVRGANLGAVKRSGFSKAWDNTITKGSNALSGALCAHPSPERPLDKGWNETAESVLPAVSAIATRAAAVGSSRLSLTPMQEDYLKRSIQRQIIGACHETQFARFVPPPFFLDLFEVYAIGHWPCGWEGPWPEGKLVVW